MNAFLGCTSLKQITIKANCTYDNAAFANSGLEVIFFEEGVETIPGAAFKGTKIKEVVLPSSVRVIESFAFEKCYDLENITLNEGLTTIEYAAFADTKIKEIIIPKSVKSIIEDVFAGCKNLTRVIFEGDAPDKFINEGFPPPPNVKFTVYFNKDAKGFTTPLWNGYKTKIIGTEEDNHKTHNGFEYIENPDGSIAIIGYTGKNTSLEIPAQIEGKNVTKIETSAFSNTDLVSVTLPDTIRSIGSRAFHNCTSLNTVVLSKNLETVDSYAFYNCTSLQTITLPASLRKLGQQAFSYCPSLKSINIPKSLTDWEYGVFAYSKIEEVVFEEGLETVGEFAFGNNSIKTIVLPQSLKIVSNNAFADCYKLESITLNEGLEYIGEYAFSSTPIKNIVLPKSLKAISQCAFYGCGQLESVTLNEGLETIGEYAFENTAITEIIIPKSVKNINALAFKNCTKLSKVKFEGDAPENYYTRDIQYLWIAYTIYYHSDAKGFDNIGKYYGFKTEVW